MNSSKKEIIYAQIISALIILGNVAFIPQATMLYALGVFLLFLLLIKGTRFIGDVKLYIFFLGAVFFSSLLNRTLTERIIYFTLVIITCSPLMSSLNNYKFKILILFTLSKFIIITTLINLYCYFAGINYASELLRGVNEYDFSGIMTHPMWLSAFSGLSMVASANFFLSSERKIEKGYYFVTLFASIFLTIVAASRIALASALIVVITSILLTNKSTKGKVSYLALIVVISLISYPFFVEKATRIIMKMESQKKNGTSRQSLWKDRIYEIEYSPIIGVGFAARLERDKQVVGRMESGSGWLSVLSQLGFLGFLGMFFLVISAIKVIKYKNKIPFINLIILIFIYLCLHSIAEGYILTAGYYLCFLFWLTLDILIQSSKAKYLNRTTKLIQLG